MADSLTRCIVALVMSTELPRPLRWAVWLLILEAVVTAVVALVLGYLAIAAEPDDLTRAMAVAGYVALLAAGLAGAAAGLHRRKPRARAPAIALQLLAVMLAVMFATSGRPLLALPVALLGMVVVTLLVAPSTHAALTR